MEGKTIRVGVVGMGKMGVLHGGILQALDGVEVCAVAESAKLITDFTRSVFPRLQVYSEYEEMLRREQLDLVYITASTPVHAAMAEACVDRGVAFFVEKPLAGSSKEALPLLRKLQKRPVINMVGYCKHYVDTFTKAKEMLDSGAVGKLHYLSSHMYVSQTFSKGSGWRFVRRDVGGGLLNTLAIHLVDVLVWLFGDVAQVQGRVKSLYSEGVEDYCHAYLAFRSGLEGYLDASWSVRNYRLPEIRIEVEGEKGKLVVTDDFLRLHLDGAEGAKTLYKQDLCQGVPIDIAGPEYTREDMHMIESLARGRPTDIDSFYAFKVQRVADAIHESAAGLAAVTVDSEVK